jgi:hypothetical protein
LSEAGRLVKLYRDLILRSRAKHGISKDGNRPQRVELSFETAALRPPQDEVLMKIRKLPSEIEPV